MRLAQIPTPDGAISRPIGIDFTAVMMLASARRVDVAMLADILPRIEAAIIDPPEPFQEADHDDA